MLVVTLQGYSRNQDLLLHDYISYRMERVYDETVETQCLTVRVWKRSSCFPYKTEVWVSYQISSQKQLILSEAVQHVYNWLFDQIRQGCNPYLVFTSLLQIENQIQEGLAGIRWHSVTEHSFNFNVSDQIKFSDKNS